MEENKKNHVITLTVDEEGFVNLEFSGKFDTENPEADVPSKLYALCCDMQKEIINWRSKRLKK